MDEIPYEALADAAFLDHVAEELDGWARESRFGGWSPHQIEKNERLAGVCRRRAAEIRRRERPPVKAPASPAAKDDGGPAFPCGNQIYAGMPLRAYAAIQLRVPASGIDWLDDMIRQAKRDEFAGQALVAVVCATSAGQHHPLPKDTHIEKHDLEMAMAGDAHAIAEAMLAARKA